MIEGIFRGKSQDDEISRHQKYETERQNIAMANEPSIEEQYLSANAMPSPDLTRWQQDVDPYIQKLILKLKRQYIDEEGRVHYLDKERLPPLCSDECIENIISLIQANTTPNTMLSKFTEAQISNMEIELENTLIIDVLLPERRKYNTPLAYMSQIKKIFRSFIKPTFYRAYKGFENNNQRKIQTVKELHTDSNRSISKKSDSYNMFNTD